MIVCLVIALYLGGMLLISWRTGRGADSHGFFTGGRRSPWSVVALAMVGAGISGVTFVSVPGAVEADGWSYLQMVLGFVAGAAVVAWVLIPLFYRMKLVSIYGYLQQRFGNVSYRTGGWIFFVSKLMGDSVRFYVVCAVLQAIAFDPMHVPFALNVLLTVALIWLYSQWGGVKSMIWTDSLKTCCLLLSVVGCIVLVARSLQMDVWETMDAVCRHPSCRIFYLDYVNDGHYFWKHFTAGIFLMIACTGLDQDLMQRTLSCSDSRKAQKNMMVSAVAQVPLIALFLLLGTLLCLYKEHYPAEVAGAAGDSLFATVVWNERCPRVVGIAFVIGLISAAYSAAGSALTALTTSFTLDILQADRGYDERYLTRIRRRVHVGMALLMAAVIIVFYYMNDDSAINAVYRLAAYTYGPILGLFAFGLVCRSAVRDAWVPVVVVVAPLLCYVLQTHSQQWLYGYRIGFELIILNAVVTMMGMMMIRTKKLKNLQT